MKEFGKTEREQQRCQIFATCTVMTRLCGDAFTLICLFAPIELNHLSEMVRNNTHEQDELFYLLQILKLLAEVDAAIFVSVEDDDGMIHIWSNSIFVSF